MMDAVQKALRVAKADGGGNVQGGPDAGVPAAGPDYSGFVSGLYQSELGRTPEAAGLKGWVDALQSGQMTQDQVRQNILASPENQVQDLYSGLLNRGTLDPGAQGWVNALQSGAMTPAQIRTGIMGSEEYKKLNPSAAGTTGAAGTTTTGTTTTAGATPVDITKQGMPLIYTPPPYKDYGATAAAFRVASGLENLPAPFYTLSPVVGGTPTGGGTTGGGTAGGKTNYQQILDQLAGGTSGTAGAGTSTAGGTKTQQPTTTTKTPYLSDVAALYQQYLGRTPEAGAAEKWANAINSGQLTYNEVANAIKSSPEYTQNQISQAYQQYLGRKPEEAGLQGWANAVTTGQMSLSDALNAIKTSQEAQGLGAAAPVAGGAQTATAPVASPVANAVAAAYQTYLGRTPDPAEVAPWAGAIASGAMTPDQVLAAIASSPEAQSYYSVPDYGRKDGGAVKGYADGGGTNYEDLVRAAYKDFLGRSPDDAGYQSWLNALTSGQIAPGDFESRFMGAGYEDDIVNAYETALNRAPTTDEVSAWNNALVKGDMTIDQVMQKINKSPEALTQPTYRNVPEPDKFSERQGGRMYDIDIGRVERIPELGRMAAPVNVKQAFENSEIERLKRELEAAKTAGTAQSRDLGGGGGSPGSGSNMGAGDVSGTAGAVQSTSESAGPPAPGSGDSPGERYGGRINAVDNALRMIKADRR